MSNTKQALHNLNIGDDTRVLQHVDNEPLIYPSKQLPYPKDTSDEGLVEHFIDFQRKYILGLIAMTRQDWATISGANCAQCVSLAQEHAFAVDFGKKGRDAC